MRARLTKLVAGIAALTALAVGGSALAGAAQKPNAPAKPAVAQKAGQGVVKPAAALGLGQAGDTDNIQDESTADTPGEAAGSESSSASESESASESGPSDGPGGYADSSPNADTQQQGEH